MNKQGQLRFDESVMNRQTDRRTDGPTDGRTDTPSYRDARTHVKRGGAVE